MGNKGSASSSYHKSVRFTIGNSRVVPNAGLLIASGMLEECSFDDALSRFTRKTQKYSSADIMKAMLASILTGNLGFEDIRQLEKDPAFYMDALHMKGIPSEATYRQRITELALDHGPEIEETLNQLSLDLLKKYNVKLTPTKEGYIVIDIDVSPFINEKCKKEGIGRTYKKEDGFAPIFAYIAQEGYLLGVEFRKGEQHCQNGTPDFIRRLITSARQLTDAPLLFRLDSGNDAAENVGIFMEECFRGNNVYFIFKRNDRGRVDHYAFLEEIRDVCPDKVTPRDGKTVFTGQTFRDVTYKIPDPTPKKPDKRTDKTVGIRAIYQITERTIDKKGQHLFPADLETDIYYCSIDLPDSRIIELYHEHGTMEQFHSEIKTDMGCELLPSGRFAVNSMILHLVQIGYNMLRLIEQRSLSWWSTVSTRRPVQRRRLATVIKNVICAPAQIKTHAREVLADLGRSNIWAGDIMWLARSLAPERATRL